ncbi:succinyl-CoA:glutarate CoA-transferase isoform X1 [Lasioglossum baleicum]|uniref:succinyl-CoA:glutarate CoA-transferase isoform X1 n=1 Tax=Lasioglossum baleicum TaxID=434251 RepID=UPI003FCECF14
MYFRDSISKKLDYKWKDQRCLNNRLIKLKRKLFWRRMSQIPYPSDTKNKRAPCTTAEDNSPLEDVRVLDLTRIVAGPYCTMILGDLGAEILKIERPVTGDEARHWGPPFVKGTRDSVYFLSVNRNKKSICIDLKEGKDIIYELAKKSDVLIENYVPGKLSKFGLGYQDISKVAPRLIYCSMTGYGYKGPYSSRPGYDVISASVGGLMHITGPKDGPPCKVGVAVTDLATGLYAHGAIMAALYQRMKTNCGQWIQCNLLATQVASLINIGSNYLNANKEAVRWGSEHESIVPYEAFLTKDGYMTVGTGSNAQFLELLKRMQLTELFENDKFKDNTARVQNRDELLDILRRQFEKKSNKDWSAIFDGASFPYGPINTIGQVFADPHVKHTKMVQDMAHSSGETVKVVGPPVTYSYATNKIRLAPPTLGQHTDEILKNILNYSDDKIRTLRKAKIVQ